MDRGSGRWFVLMIISVTALVFGIISMYYGIENYNRLNNFIIGDTPKGNECNDYDECTADYILIDGTCVHRQKKVGSSCNTDVCYGNATDKKCCDDGQCVSNRRNCLGICPTNGFQYNTTSNCSLSLFPLNYAQFDSFFFSCVHGSCTLTTVQNLNEKRALDDSYMYNISSCNKNANYTKSKCIQRYCTTANTPITVCIFRYRCASYNFTTNLMNSISRTKGNIDITDHNESLQNLIDFPTFGEYIDRDDYTVLNNDFNKALISSLKDLHYM